MLFNPNVVDETLLNGGGGSSSSALKMFSPTSPSPTRSMIKEANDHLQLLHQRVLQLEKTVQEQAEALIKKDELMQQKLTELSEMKDNVIADLKQTVSTYDQQVKKLEQQCRDNSRLMELMSQKCLSADELEAYIPTLDKLLTSMRKLSSSPSSKRNTTSTASAATTTNSTSNCVHNAVVGAKSGGTGGGSRSRKVFRGYGGGKNEKFYRGGSGGGGDATLLTSDGSGSLVDGVAPDRSGNSLAQLADLRIGRSFNINSNFSMSEDEEEKFS